MTYKNDNLIKDRLSNVEIKKIALDVLIEIKRICDENGFRYFLAYGTLIGAIRHKGFIPWDDDIDIAMPKPDYLKLIKYFETNDTGYYKLISHENDKNYIVPFLKIMDMRYVVKENNTDDCDWGVFVDVFPIEGAGVTKEEASHNYDKNLYGQRLLWYKAMRKYQKQNNLALDIVKYGLFVYSKFVSKKAIFKRINKYSNKCKFEDANYFYVFSCRKVLLSKEDLSEVTNVEFENIQFTTIKNYDYWLTSIYGDYMKLPPENERITHGLIVTKREA